MSEYPITPFYFPTTVVFVDDNTDFLANLSLQLAPELAFQLCTSPDKALMLLNALDNLNTPGSRLFTQYHDTEDLPMTHHVIDVNLEKVQRELYNDYRSEQVSVAVVDYDMPRMDGIEFLRKIKNKTIKKILLTGKADEKVAVQAFNEGLISRFILKQENDVASILNQEIIELQQDYFRDSEHMLSNALALGRHEFLRDPLFAKRFQSICQRLGIVEYYLCSEPDGMLLLDAEGKSRFLLVPSDDAIQGQYEIAFDQAAPADLLKALRNNNILPYFWRFGGHWTPECQDWRSYMHPAIEFKGQDKWFYYALVSNPDICVERMVLPYREFLKDMDLRRWCDS